MPMKSGVLADPCVGFHLCFSIARFKKAAFCHYSEKKIHKPRNNRPMEIKTSRHGQLVMLQHDMQVDPDPDGNLDLS